MHSYPYSPLYQSIHQCILPLSTHRPIYPSMHSPSHPPIDQSIHQSVTWTLSRGTVRRLTKRLPVLADWLLRRMALCDVFWTGAALTFQKCLFKLRTQSNPQHNTNNSFTFHRRRRRHALLQDPVSNSSQSTSSTHKKPPTKTASKNEIQCRFQTPIQCRFGTLPIDSWKWTAKIDRSSSIMQTT